MICYIDDNDFGKTITRIDNKTVFTDSGFEFKSLSEYVKIKDKEIEKLKEQLKIEKSKTNI